MPFNLGLKLTDKTAFVSASTKGIGFAIATGLAREGARVIVNGRSEKAHAKAKAQPDSSAAVAQLKVRENLWVSIVPKMSLRSYGVSYVLRSLFWVSCSMTER